MLLLTSIQVYVIGWACHVWNANDLTTWYQSTNLVLVSNSPFWEGNEKLILITGSAPCNWIVWLYEKDKCITDELILVLRMANINTLLQAADYIEIEYDEGTGTLKPNTRGM